MQSRPRGRTGRTTFLLLLVVGVIAAMLSVPTAQATPASAARTKASASTGDSAGRQAQAQRALTRAERLFNGSRARATREATLVLLDLVKQRSSLSGADADRARELLARPPSTNVTCAVVCVHWTTGQVDPTDANANTIPDYIDLAASTLASVHNTYVAAGYRPPKPDGAEGGSALTDIYIDDIGPDGLYGYCTSDEEAVEGAFDLAAYCVLDNDYSTAEFPTNTPTENLQVTAAHEYFHAVQFAYDAFEDRWFLEATATWAEDELYDDVDDNVQYLSQGPLKNPRMPMDTFDSQGLFQYGTWIFFRYLTERYTTEEGGLPTLVRDMWRKADGSAGAQDQYSLQAVASVLAAQGTNLTKVFSEFVDANRTPAFSYSEGAANSYPTAAPAGTFKLSPSRSATKWLSIRLDHLTSATARFVPSGKLKTLRVKIDMAPKARGSSVIVTTYLKSGNANTTFLPLNAQGDGAKSFPFKPSVVQFVEVTQVNASGRFTCWQNSPFSCQGAPKDDGLIQKLRGIASN